MENNLKLEELNRRLAGKSIAESLSELVAIFPGKVVFTSSFGIEDQVITHFIFRNDLPIEVMTIDTGRLFPETYNVYSYTKMMYKKPVKVFFPDHEDIEKMVSEKGPLSFFLSIEDRKECCQLRKVKPLERALRDKSCWVTGIRAGQSENRSRMNKLEYDEEKKIFKFHPLYDWSFEEVQGFVKKNGIPYNTLHDKGFVSIGCEPCTRAISRGQDFRAGRWWWENSEARECGCHSE
jgi:phosphoadenosine phosphosulfate reductase